MVKDSNTQKLLNIALFNNLGQIDANYPFYIFGPSPVIGSYLGIKSSELSNKDIAQIIIQITWVGLPLNFSSYYDGYKQEIDNTSFKVNFSLFHNGEYQLLHESSLNLFNENIEEKNILEISSFYLQLNKKLNFTDIQDCYFIMKLIKPEDAFCQNIYPILLPEAHIFNSKWWRKWDGKKMKIPNPPYIPIVKTIDMFYSLFK
jgi:hypothetical protein